MPLRLKNEVRVEAIGDELIVLDQSGAVVHRVAGDAASALRFVVDGIDVPAELDGPLESLIDAGVVERDGLSRRRLLLAAGAGAAGITTFALAAPTASASFGCPGTFKPSSATHKDGGAALVDFTFNTGKGATLLTFEGWGGGGGGGGGAKTSNPGGGGGGGAYAKVTLSSTYFVECTTYTIKIGSDGSGGTAGKADGDGGAGSEMKVGLRNAGDTADVVKDIIKAKGGAKGSKSGGAGGAGGTGSSANTGAGAVLARSNDGGAGAKTPDSSKGGGGGGAAGDGLSATGGAASGATGGTGGSSGGGNGGGGGASATAGSSGSAPGGGGGGGGSGATTGGAGAAGRLKVSWS